LLVGALFAFGLLALLSIGLLLLLAAVVGTVVLSRRPAAGRGLPGVIVGVGIAALFIAYRNRGGPVMSAPRSIAAEANVPQTTGIGTLGPASHILVTARTPSDPSRLIIAIARIPAHEVASVRSL
jgi:hypothetical protein